MSATAAVLPPNGNVKRVSLASTSSALTAVPDKEAKVSSISCGARQRRRIERHHAQQHAVLLRRFFGHRTTGTNQGTGTLGRDKIVTCPNIIVNMGGKSGQSRCGALAFFGRRE